MMQRQQQSARVVTLDREATEAPMTLDAVLAETAYRHANGLVVNARPRKRRATRPKLWFKPEDVGKSSAIEYVQYVCRFCGGDHGRAPEVVPA